MSATGTTNGETKAMQKAEPNLMGLMANPETQKRLTEVATKHLPVEKLLRLVTGEIRRVPELARCSIASVMRCVMDLARLGLEPGPLGLAYLIPFKGECTLVIGFRGLVELARRSGQIDRIDAKLVYEAEANDPDRFTYEAGSSPKLIHKPMLTGDRGDVVAAYVIAVFKDGSQQIEVMTADEIFKIRDRSRAAKSGPWVTDTGEMMKKTVVRRGAKYWPLSAEDWRRALEVEADDFDTGEPAKVERKAPPSLREALNMAPPERDAGEQAPIVEGSVEDRQPGEDG